MINKMAVSGDEKPKIDRYYFRNCKTGDFNPWRTLLEPHSIIPESVVAFCSVVLAPKAIPT